MRLGTWQRWALLGLLALFATLGSTAAWAQKAKGRDISGAIVDPSGAPITGATVTVQGTATPMTAQSDANGAFKIAAVPQTNLTLTVTADGYEPQQVEVIGAKTALQLQVVLVKTPPPAPPEMRVISGVIVDGKRNPVASATVSISGGPSVTTDADGTFTLPGVTTADVTLDVSAEGLPTAHEEVPAAKGAVVIMLGEPETGVTPVNVPTSKTITGIVKETDTGEPLIGATVIITGTDLSAITDENGQYSIEGVPLKPITIEFSGDQHESKVVDLPEDATTADETLALTQTEQIIVEGRAPVILKQNLANGASTVSDKDLNRVSAPTLDSALQGKLAGANMQFNSGAPGGGAQLRLRGISTINGQSSPLYVIDGVIVSNIAVPSGANAITAAAAGGSASNQDNPVNRIADLNPNDIESVEVLKGASAAALYGSKAANGVVIITTKRGHGGGTTVNITQRFGTSMLSNEIGSRHFYTRDQVIEAYGAGSPLVTAFDNANGQTFDHEKEVIQTKLAEETIASAAGGTDKGNYYGSVLVHDEPGIVIGTYYKKQSGRISLGYDLWDRVKLGVTANLIHSTSDRGLTNNDNTGTSLYVVLSGTPNFVDLRPTNGVYPVNPAVGSGANPIQTVHLFSNTEDVWRLIAGTNAQIDAYHNDASKVSILGNFGADSFDQKNNIFSPPELIYEPGDGLSGTSINASTVNFNFNVGAGVLWDFKPKGAGYHSALSAGATYESVDLDSVYVTAQNLTGGQNAVDSGTAVQVTENRLRTKDSGVYLQEEMALLDDKLSLLGGLLGERSSLNGDPNHYYLFPKLAGTYEIPALKDKLDTLRARAAFGEAGNRPNYGQRFTPLNATTNIGGNAGLTVGGTAGDPNIKPELQREEEIGLDAAAKNDRAVLELTFYNRRVTDLLLQRSLATSSGFTTEFFNGGALRNRGVEIALQVTPVTGAVDWTSRAIFTMNRSSIRSLPVPAFDITVAGFGTGLGAYRIERDRSATQIVTIDANGKEVVLGDGEPDFRVGWSNTITHGNWTLQGLLDWQQGSKIVNLTRLLYDFGNVSPDSAAARDRLDQFLNKSNVSPYVEDASFIKVREISLTYDFPKKWATQIGPVQTLELQLAGRNLFTFSKYSGLDPEVSNFGNQPIGRNYDVAPYPPSRSYWLSVSAGL